MPILSRAVKNAAAMMRAVEFGDSSIPSNSQLVGGAGSTAFGGEQSALTISTVMACVKALHDDFKVLNFAGYTGDPNGAYSLLPEQPPIITEPFGPDLEPSAGFGQIVVSDVMRGNAYYYVTQFDGLGFPLSGVILHPDKVRPDRDATTGQKFFRIGSDKFGTDVIKHITGLMLPGAVAGIDVLSYQRVTHETSMQVARYAGKVFSNGGIPSGVISVPGSGDRKKAREVKEGWENNHAGIENAHRPAVLFGGATWQAVTITPENAQYLGTRGFLREEVCGLYNVPLQRIQAITDNASQGGGKGLDAIDAQYIRHGLLVLANDIESVWNRMVPGKLRTFCRFDFDVFLRASAEVRAAIAQIHRVGSIRTIDEIRGDEGWAPLPNNEGADPFRPLNSNVSPAGGADNAPTPGGQGGNSS